MIINTILLGPPFLVPAIDFPQRFQTVNHLSPLEAALRFLAYAVSMPFGSAVASVAMTKYRAPPYAVLLSGGVFLTVGSTFFSLLPIKEEITASTYGYQVLIGLGVGGNLAALVLLTPFVVSSTDLAVAMSAINQFRLVGGATGLAICANVMGNYVERRLNGILPPSAVRRVLESFSQISTVAVAQQEEARAIFGEGFNLEMRVLIGFCAAQIPASFLIWGASLAE
ncbi:MAG: hypothetical protein M1831_000938 [Alyxoria varia]|nr:MAG: hypothetical protein M1831_000938 [Alyxoria varia]